MSSSIEKLISEWRGEVKNYAKAVAQYEYLYEFRKSKLSLLMNDAMSQGIEAANAQERYARSHPEYITLLEGLRVSKEQAEDLRYRMKIAEARISVWQTKEANARAEFKKYGN